MSHGVDIVGGTFLITGGASLVGSHLVDQLLEGGAAAVRIFDNYSLGSLEVLEHVKDDPRVRIIRGDILRLNELYDALEGVDAVFAVAAFLTLPLSQNPWLGIDVNVRGAQNVLEACRYRGVKKLVFSSSTATFGDPPESPITEDTSFHWQRAQPAVAIYGATKLIGENLCRMYRDRYGLNYVALRYSTIYGERQHYRGVNALYIVQAYDRIKAGEPPVIPGDGSEAHDYVYVGDVARANVAAMTSDVSGESFLISSGVDTSLNELVRMILAECGSDLQPIHYDEPGKVSASTKPKIGFSPRKAADQLGWRAEIDVAEGVRRVIRWRESF